MKKIINTIKVSILLFFGLTASSAINAQNINNMYLNFDWQLNMPLSNSFADQFSGWGANVDAGYYLTDNIGVGAFLSYHTNRKYIDKQTLTLGEGSNVTTDQQHSIFQLPFGVAARYSFTPGNLFQPYVGLKLGTAYSKVSTYMNVFELSDKRWGFYVSPEIGANVYLDPQNRFGIHVATYYSYSTNKSEVLGYTIDGLNNWGVRIGVSF